MDPDFGNSYFSGGSFTADRVGRHYLNITENVCMEDPIDINRLKDRGGRRVLPDRRQRSSSEHFPERRSYRHRRSGNDRRSMQNQKIRKRKERRREFREKYSK